MSANSMLAKGYLLLSDLASQMLFVEKYGTSKITETHSNVVTAEAKERKLHWQEVTLSYPVSALKCAKQLKRMDGRE